MRLGKSNDQRKPSGYAIPVTSFPPRITLPITPASNRAVKRRGVAKNIMSLRGAHLLFATTLAP